MQDRPLSGVKCPVQCWVTSQSTLLWGLKVQLENQVVQLVQCSVQVYKCTVYSIYHFWNIVIVFFWFSYENNNGIFVWISEQQFRTRAKRTSEGPRPLHWYHQLLNIKSYSTFVWCNTINIQDLRAEFVSLLILNIFGTLRIMIILIINILNIF